MGLDDPVSAPFVGGGMDSAFRWRQCVCVALHLGPGDAISPKPLAGWSPHRKRLSPSPACGSLCDITSELGSSGSECFYAWNGQAIAF
jgi:hypothetical protein